MLSRKAFARLAAPLLAAFAALSLSACGEYHMMSASPPPRQTSGAPELFAGGAGRPGPVIAVVQSSPRAGLDDATLAKHVRELKRAASRAGADAVINTRVLVIKKEGFVGDPAPPFPAIKQDAYKRYVMRGDAIVYSPPPSPPQPRPEPELAAPAPEAFEPAVSDSFREAPSAEPSAESVEPMAPEEPGSAEPAEENGPEGFEWPDGAERPFEGTRPAEPAAPVAWPEPAEPARGEPSFR